MDHREQRRWRQRSEDPGFDQRGEPAGHGALVHARQRGPVLRDGCLAGPQPVYRAERLRREPIPAVGRGVHELRGEPLRVPVPDGPPGPVLQHRHVRGSRDRRATGDLVRAPGRREEADRLQLRRVDQGRGLRAVVRLLRVQHAEPGEPVRREVVQRGRFHVGGRHGCAMEGHVPVAARLHRRRVR